MAFAFWLKHILLTLGSVFFLAFGIHILLAAYALKNPLEFIMAFFGSNLMILVSLAGLAYPATRIFFYLRDKNGTLGKTS